MTIGEFCRALQAFCVEHGFEIAGTCQDEGIYGEITVVKISEEPPNLEDVGLAVSDLEEAKRLWQEWQANKFNFVDANGDPVGAPQT